MKEENLPYFDPVFILLCRFPSSGETAVREEDVLRFCFPDKEAIRPVRYSAPIGIYFW